MKQTNPNGTFNVPKFVVFCWVNLTTIAYGCVLLPWVWENLPFDGFNFFLIVCLCCFAIWLPLFNSLFMVFFAREYLDESLITEIMFAIPALVVVLILIKYGERFIAPCRSDQAR